MTKSKIFLYLCLFFIGGVFIASFFKIPLEVLWGILIFGIILITVWRKERKILVFGFCLIVLSFGIFRFYQVNKIETSPDFVHYYNGKGKVSFEGIISEPDIKKDKIKIVLNAEKIFFQKEEKEISGKVLATLNRYPEYQYGDYLKFFGGLKTPEEFEEFNYPAYLAKDEIYSLCFYPKAELISSDNGNKVYANILKLKNKFADVLETTFSEPQASILSAMLLGRKQGIDEATLENFNRTSTRHIIAISGLHITIVIFLLMYFALAIGFYRRQAFWFSLIVVSFYIILIGAPPSAVRAGIMGGLILTAEYFGRLNQSWRAIIFAGALMLLANPKILTSDIGFQLSFMAALGIIFLFPLFQNLFKKIPDFFKARTTLCLTLSAQIFTLPLLVFHFGNLSIVSILANILIVPLVPVIMVGGMIVIFFGSFWIFLGKIISWPVWLLITYQLKIIEFLSNISFAAISVEKFNVFWILIYYLFLAGILAYIRRKKPEDEYEIQDDIWTIAFEKRF